MLLCRVVLELDLKTEDGRELYLFNLTKHPDDAYITADAYIAQERFSVGTVFHVKQGDKVVLIETRSELQQGLYFYPGDPHHFGKLAEPPLLIQLEVRDVSKAGQPEV